MRRIAALLLVAWIAVGLLVPPAECAELKSATVAAFDRYVRVTESRMDDDLRENYFLFIDRLPENSRRVIDAQLREGKVEIQQLHTLEEGRGIPVPSGMIHHWVGVIFIPNATLPQARAVLDDYDNYMTYYKPDVRRAKLYYLRERHGKAAKIKERRVPRGKAVVEAVVEEDEAFDAVEDTEVEAVGEVDAVDEVEVVDEVEEEATDE